jgi:hypothetical protein
VCCVCAGVVCVPSSTEHISREISFTIASNSSELLAEEMVMVGYWKERSGGDESEGVGRAGDEKREEN